MRVATLIVATAMIAAIPAQAKLPYVGQAKKLGFTEITNCQSCHVDKMPKKEAHAPNERGAYLIAMKANNKVAEVDLNWLKDYKGK